MAVAEDITLSEDTLFCCEACGTILPSLQEIAQHIELCHGVKAVLNGGQIALEAIEVQPQSELVVSHYANSSQEWTMTSSPNALKNNETHSSAYVTTQCKSSGTVDLSTSCSSLPVIPATVIEEIVEHPMGGTGSLSNHHSANVVVSNNSVALDARDNMNNKYILTMATSNSSDVHKNGDLIVSPISGTTVGSGTSILVDSSSVSYPPINNSGNSLKNGVLGPFVSNSASQTSCGPHQQQNFNQQTTSSSLNGNVVTLTQQVPAAASVNSRNCRPITTTAALSSATVVAPLAIISNPHQCNQCVRSFTSERDLSVHVETQHGMCEYVCNFCSKQFDQQHTLKSHIVALHRKHLINVQELDVFRYGWAKEVRVFPCSFCNKGCSSKHHLEQHMRTHTENTHAGVANSEKGAGGVFSSTSSNSSQQQRVVCHLCPVENRCSFGKGSQLAKHLAAEHPNSVVGANQNSISHSTQGSRSTSSGNTNSNAHPLISGFTVEEGAEICTPRANSTSDKRLVPNDTQTEDNSRILRNTESDDVMAAREKNVDCDLSNSSGCGEEHDPILNCFIVQDSTGRYTCTLCEKKFQDRAILRKHLLTKHLVQAPDISNNPSSRGADIADSSASSQNCEVIYLTTSTNGNAVALNGNCAGEISNGQHLIGADSSTVVVDQSQLTLGVGGEVLVDSQGPLGMTTNMYISEDGQTGFVLGGTQLVDENGHVMSVDVEEEIVLSSADVVVDQSQLSSRNNSDEVDTRTANQLFMQFPSSKELDDGFVDIENRVATQEIPPAHKLRRYQCPDCNRSFKKFTKLQIHIQNTHPEVYAAAEIQSCESDQLATIEVETTPNATRNPVRRLPDSARDPGLLVNQQHNHLPVDSVHGCYSHLDRNSPAINHSNSSAILNHVSSTLGQGELADTIIIHDPKNDATSEFYQMEIITSGDVDSTSGNIIGGLGAVEVGGVIQVPKSPSSPSPHSGVLGSITGGSAGVVNVATPSAVTISTTDVNYYAVSNERPYLCQECGKAYKTRSHLTQHIRYHTGEKPFKCDICGSNFHLSGDRNRHVIKMHSDYRPHKCPYCPKGFVDRYALTNHLKFHSGESTFKCEYCTETFLSKAQMKQHRITHFF